jgi:hypothetical protein
MEWKKGDMAISIYTIYKELPNSLTGIPTKKKIVEEGKLVSVEEVFEGPCQPLLYIGVCNFDSIPVRCTCARCSPRHGVLAQPFGDEKIFLLSHWFIKTNDKIGNILYQIEKIKNRNTKREEFLRDNPVEHGERAIII